MEEPTIPGERGERPRRGSLLAVDLVVFATLSVAPGLPVALAIPSLAVALLAWLWTRPPVVEAVAASLTAGVAAAFLLHGVSAVGDGERTLARAEPQLEAAYRDLWASLETAAGRGVAAVPGPPGDRDELLAVYATLAEEVEALGGDGGLTFLLVDPDGVAVSWAGRGLLHEPRPQEVPREGRSFFASFGTVTLVAVEPLGLDARPWRVVAGRSLDSSRLPFAAPVGWASEDFRWTLVDESEAAGDDAVLLPASLVLSVDGLPTMYVQQIGAVSGRARVEGESRRLAWATVALGLLAVAVARILATVLGGAPVSRGGEAVLAALVGSSAVAGALACGARVEIVVAVGVAVAVGATGVVLRRVSTSGAAAAAAGAAAMVAVAFAASALMSGIGPLDLAQALLQGAELVALRVAACAAVFGLLAVAAGTGGGSEERRGDGWALLATAALFLCGAVHDAWGGGLLLLALGGAAVALWLRQAWWARPVVPVVLLLLASLASADAWELAYRQQLRQLVQRELLPSMAPPGDETLDAFRSALERHFAGLDLTAIAVGSPDPLRRDDLAYLLWRDSPLARGDALSALAVLPRDGEPVRFAYGIPLTDRGELDTEPVRWSDVELGPWDELLITGRAALSSQGRPWGTLRYWVLPLPGFSPQERPVEDVSSGLLRGTPLLEGPAGRLPRGVELTLLDATGEVLYSSWSEPAAVPGGAAGGAMERVETPTGDAWAFARSRGETTEVLYLPVPSGVEALERVAFHALGVLVPVSCVAVLGFLFALSRAGLRRRLRRAVRSYSKRLLLVYGALLTVPLLSLNLLLIRHFENRLQHDQLAHGEAALSSAQQVLGEYVASLEPGFGLGTALDDTLLVWLSRVLHHEINVYWGSNIDASSKRELFSAGLLPGRIPGEVYTELALQGAELAARTSRAGDTEYLELYAPLSIPGVPATERRVFISVPLLVQQEEAARELSDYNRRALLLTTVLLLAAALVGTRLSTSFTRPLEDLVEGTKRIAAGAASLDLAPSEYELAALVEAVDDMAGRIAVGRERLLAEKQLVERIVQQITSGIVSLDPEGRVMMANRVATELLGVGLGDRLVEVVGRSRRFGPVAAFLAGVGDEVAETTVRLTADGEEMELRLVWAPVPGGGAPDALLVVEDATEVLRSQRLEAWAEMARVIAHEVKNPLTPIRLSTDHMLEVWRREPEKLGEVMERCAANILRQVDELQQIVLEFSTYSGIPSLDKQPADLVAEMRRLAASYEAGSRAPATVRLDAAEESLSATFDARLLRRSVRNLIENALRASPEGGEVVLRVERRDGSARITVTDSGPGVAEDDLPRIFDPYFSTHDTGTGLGLPIARRVVEEHGGSIQARNREPSGLEVAITMPLS